MEKIRVMRVLIYEGTREWVEKTIGRSITGTKHVDSFGNKITVRTIEEFPQILEDHETSTQEN